MGSEKEKGPWGEAAREEGAEEGRMEEGEEEVGAATLGVWQGLGVRRWGVLPSTVHDVTLAR